MATMSLIMQNAKTKKNFSPIVQPLVHPNTQKELQTKLFLYFLGIYFKIIFFSKKWYSSERVKPMVKYNKSVLPKAAQHKKVK
jgi:hypothetical protein